MVTHRGKGIDVTKISREPTGHEGNKERMDLTTELYENRPRRRHICKERYVSEEGTIMNFEQMLIISVAADFKNKIERLPERSKTKTTGTCSTVCSIDTGYYDLHIDKAPNTE